MNLKSNACFWLKLSIEDIDICKGCRNDVSIQNGDGNVGMIIDMFWLIKVGIATVRHRSVFDLVRTGNVLTFFLKF